MKFDTSVREWRAAVDDSENYSALVDLASGGLRANQNNFTGCHPYIQSES